MRRISILLIAVTLLVGIVGCEGDGGESYALAITSTSGGNVTTPGEGIFAYSQGTVVNLEAETEEGYRFVNWTGDVTTVADINDAATNITMNSSYNITANFVETSVIQYQLAINSTEGGNVTAPSEGEFTYDAATVVNMMAEADECHRFVNWTGDADTIGNVTAAVTTITMNGDYSITANFEGDTVVFPDPNLEARIRGYIGKPTGDICPSDLAGITSFEAVNHNIAQLTGLEYCTDLTWLDLGNNQIGDISPLANLTNLTGLNLGWNEMISDVSPLANLTNLTWLNLQHNQIGDISPLANLVGLTGLQLKWNRIIDISPVANLTNLTGLNLGFNQIGDISPLASLPTLWNLDLGYNRISDISPLANFTDLTELDLWSNRISDISPLANLSTLTELTLHHNEIGDIAPLANLTSLSNLQLHYNQIGNISSLSDLTSLTYLSLHDNQISDIYPLVENAGLDTGDAVSLVRNPLSDDSINIYIPELQARGVSVSW